MGCVTDHKNLVTDCGVALSVLQQHADNMIVMDFDFLCWIRRGVKDADGRLVANGEFVAAISEEVFKELSIDMEQDFCSQYRQSCM